MKSKILDPDIAGLEWWCNRLAKRRSSIPRMWQGMYNVGERQNEMRYALTALRVCKP